MSSVDHIRYCDSPLGRITLACDESGLTGLWFEGQAHYGEGISEAHEEGEAPVLDAAVRWLDAYFAGRDPGFTPPLSPRGTDFRRSVWRELLTIPFGQTMTYGELAERLHTSARAVGGAIAHNHISLIVPCHRVMGANGSLTGYAGGIDRKTKLLELEGIR